MNTRQRIENLKEITGKSKLPWNDKIKSVLAAKYSEPSWFSLKDYNLNVDNILNLISKSEENLGRIILPNSFQLANFGKYMSTNGESLAIIGLLYQYCMKTNPRHISFGCHLLSNNTKIYQASELPSVYEAKNRCQKYAEEYISNLIGV